MFPESQFRMFSMKHHKRSVTTLLRDASREDNEVAILAWVAYAMTPLSIQVLEAAVIGMHTNSSSLAAYSENKSFFHDESIRAHFGASVDDIDDVVS